MVENQELKVEEIITRARNSQDDFLVQSTLQVRDVIEKQSKYGKLFFNLKLGDITGDLLAKKWTNEFTNIEELRNTFQVGNFIKIFGTYELKWGLKLNREQLKNVEDINLEDFFLEGTTDVETLKTTLKDMIDNLGNEDLKELIRKIFSDAELYEKFCNVPASIIKHHAYKYGNLQHTISMVNNFINMKDFYDGDTDLD
ncbi:MAG: hypothetical protein ACFFCS_25295, partial [Candidatus Hodarchaeota archaeon]